MPHFLKCLSVCSIAACGGTTLDGEEAILADVEVRWMGGVVETHTFVKWCTGFVPWLGGLTEVESVSSELRCLQLVVWLDVKGLRWTLLVVELDARPGIISA